MIRRKAVPKHYAYLLREIVKHIFYKDYEISELAVALVILVAIISWQKYPKELFGYRPYRVLIRLMKERHLIDIAPSLVVL